MRILIGLFALSVPQSGNSEPLRVLTDARMELAAIQINAELPGCTGMLVAPDMMVTARHCLFDDTGHPLGVASALPGLNSTQAGGPSAAKPAAREFAVASFEQSPQISILRLGSVEGRPPLENYMPVTAHTLEPSIGDTFDILHYAGVDQPFQAFTRCAVTGVFETSGSLDCILPAMALGAPVLHDGQPVGVIQDPENPGGAGYGLFPNAGLIDIAVAEVTALPVLAFAAVDIVNSCDVDIHQGLFWLDLDGRSWRDTAKRVPAHSRMTLPVATIGDSVFSYARSDDGALVWDGDDLKVEINGIALSMIQVPVPQPTGDLTLSYTCE